jgi:large conductance mechanosensitive channel
VRAALEALVDGRKRGRGVPLDRPPRPPNCFGMPPMLEEFKKFAMRGNVVDLAVGVIIGAAFGGIVQSLVGDIFMPMVGALTGGIDFSNDFIPLSSKVTAATLIEARRQGAVLAWGNFLTLLINFMIIAWVLFLVVRFMNRLTRQEVKSAPAPTREEVLLAEIRDLLKQRPSS